MKNATRNGNQLSDTDPADVENTVHTRHIVPPVEPAEAAEMAIDDLEKVAGGLFSIDTKNDDGTPV